MGGASGAGTRGQGSRRITAALQFKTAKNSPNRQTRPSPDQPLHPSRHLKTRKTPQPPPPRWALPPPPPLASETRRDPRGLGARPP